MSAPTSKYADAGLAALRVAGFFMASHGWQKLFGDGLSFSAIGSFADGPFAQHIEGMGFFAPGVFAWAAMLSELIGGLFVGLGLFTRVSAGFAGVTMFVAAFLAHGQDPFEKKELALMYLLTFVAITAMGPGKWSVDRHWRKKG